MYDRDNIFVRLTSLPSTINGFERENPDQSYTVLINDKISFQAQRECYRHELRHIRNRDLEGRNADAVELKNSHKKGDNYGTFNQGNEENH